jgi:hypothetical protein
MRLEPQRPRAFVYNGPIDLFRAGQRRLQIARIEDLPRDHRLIKYLNPKSDTRYYVVDANSIKGLHFNKEVCVLDLSITRKGDRITITLQDAKAETHADFTPAEEQTGPEDQLALKDFQELESRLKAEASNPDALPLIIAIQMELREKYEDHLEEAEIKSVLDRIQGLILQASGALPAEPGPVATAAADDVAPVPAREWMTTAAATDPVSLDLLALLHKAVALEEIGEGVQSREMLDEADHGYLEKIAVDTEGRRERIAGFGAALEADARLMDFLRAKDWPLLKLSSIRLQEEEARKQEPLARKELTAVRDGFRELTGRPIQGKPEAVRAQKEYKVLRQREKDLYVEVLVKPHGKYRSVNIWQSEYPESYRKHLLGLSSLRDEVIISKVKARMNVTGEAPSKG